jgi:hypothetical protein
MCELILSGTQVGMTIARSSSGWLSKGGTFFVCCLCTTALMRLLMLEYEFVWSLPFASLSLVAGALLVRCTLRRWRFIAPLRCASAVGVCAGIAGPGLFALFPHAIGYLLPSYFGPVQSF